MTQSEAPSIAAGATWRDYLELTKPRVVALMIALTVVNYSVPIFQLLRLPQTSVPAVAVGAQR